MTKILPPDMTNWLQLPLPVDHPHVLLFQWGRINLPALGLEGNPFVIHSILAVGVDREPSASQLLLQN